VRATGPCSAPGSLSLRKREISFLVVSADVVIQRNHWCYLKETCPSTKVGNQATTHASIAMTAPQIMAPF
jgi:hypothetical protein